MQEFDWYIVRAVNEDCTFGTYVEAFAYMHDRNVPRPRQIIGIDRLGNEHVIPGIR
jgi:hypothetical protein